jgi:hypothetical protein
MITAQDRLQTCCNGPRSVRGAGNPELAVGQVTFRSLYCSSYCWVTALSHVLKTSCFQSLLIHGSVDFPSTDVLSKIVGTIQYRRISQSIFRHRYKPTYNIKQEVLGITNRLLPFDTQTDGQTQPDTHTQPDSKVIS